MRILHVNDVAQVGTALVRASGGRDLLFQPALRRDAGDGLLGTARLAVRRFQDVLQLRRAFRREAITHVHVHYATFAHLAELGGLPFSLHLHGGDIIGDMKGGAKARLVRRALGRARCVIVSTPDLVERARGFRADVVYIPNPVERPSTVSPDAPHDHPRVIMLSKMDYLKGWDRQVRVMVDLRKLWPSMSFSFLSDGQLPAAEKRELIDRLTALGGTPLPLLARDDFLERIAAADCAIGQMEVGALGMSELEALARGVITVADASAYAGTGAIPPVVAPAAATRDLAALWTGGRDARVTWARRADEYLRAHHDPQDCLRHLERILEGHAA